MLPNFAIFNVVSEVAHSVPVPGRLILFNSLYALLYATAVTSAAVLIFRPPESEMSSRTKAGVASGCYCLAA